MGESSHCAEFANRQDQEKACADAPKTPAETTPPHHGWGHTTIEDFYREGMGVAGKE
jgi:hypothetical protein